MHYINETSNTSFLNKKVIFLQGSPLLEETKGIKTGRLSGIVAHYTPSFLKQNTMPSWETNCIEDWEKKVLEISKETLKEDMAAIGGIPPWVIMDVEKLLEITGKKTIKQMKVGKRQQTVKEKQVLGNYLFGKPEGARKGARRIGGTFQTKGRLQGQGGRQDVRVKRKRRWWERQSEI